MFDLDFSLRIYIFVNMIQAAGSKYHLTFYSNQYFDDID
jgi:hypothetical protein